MGGIEGRKAEGTYDEYLISGMRSMVGEDHVSWMVDHGLLFGFYDENIDLDAAENNDVLVVTGDKEVHVTLVLDVVGGSVVAQIYEDTVTSDDGTPISVNNFNRVSQSDGVVAATTAFKTPTVTSLGTLFVNRRALGGDSVGKSIASSVQGGSHRVLKPNTKYLLRQVGTVNDTEMTLVCSFWEE